MPVSSRRNFLRQTTLGAAAVGAIVATPTLFEGRAQAAPVQPEAPALALDVPVVALLTDAERGVFSLMVGEREVSFVDKQMAARISRAVR